MTYVFYLLSSFCSLAQLACILKQCANMLKDQSCAFTGKFPFTTHRVLLRGASNRDTHLYPPHNNSSASLTTTYGRCSGRIINGTWSGRTTPQDPHFNSRHQYTPPGMTLPRRAWVRLNRLRTGVRHYRSCLQWQLVVKLAGRAGKFNILLNIWDCRPSCFYK